jgi:hypothetical protein
LGNIIRRIVFVCKQLLQIINVVYNFFMPNDIFLVTKKVENDSFSFNDSKVLVLRS